MLFVLNYKAMKLVTAILITAGALSVDAWSSRQSHDNSRRQFLSTTTTTASGILSAFFVPSIRNAAATNTSPLIEELKESKAKLEAVPALLAKEEWEQVRTILKTPPVNKLWNLGDSQNILIQLAKDSGNVDLFELKDELATTIQTCDQLTYANVFVYYQPGNGKVNIKEPVALAKQAIQQLQQAIDMANE